MVEIKDKKQCKKCGVTLVESCPVTEEDLCQKKKALTCPSCQFVELEEDDTAKCNHPDKDIK
ncbi:MAG: hypothetical protein SCK28_04935 [Bacillota bacterium]|nr:hypothetical protein [Bacillota bacterium]